MKRIEELGLVKEHVENRIVTMRDTPIRAISVLIPDGETWDSVKVLRCLGQAPAVRNHVLSKTRRPLARFSRYCVGCHHHTSQNDSDWINAISSLIQKLQIDVVLPVTDKGVELLVRNREAIAAYAAIVPLPGLEPLKTVQNKWAFYRFGKERGLPMIPSILVSEAEGSSLGPPDLESIEYPALLKPTSLAGGLGIVRVEKASDFQWGWEDTRIRKNHEYLLQSYVPGVDVCVQVFCKHGRIFAYTVQKSLSLSNDYFGPQRVMEFVEDNEAVELVARLVTTIGFEGIACIDFRIDARDQTWKILEVNPRFGQAVLGSLVAGINFPLIACLDALGIDYPDNQYRTIKYAHPIAHAKMLMSQLICRNKHLKIGWCEGGLDFTRNDPLPEIFDMLKRAGRRLRIIGNPK